jgi:hypothetical protein
MIYQQISTAIKRAYAGEDVSESFSEAKKFRRWLETLKIDPKLRDPLVEPIEWIEIAFEDLMKQKDP